MNYLYLYLIIINAAEFLFMLTDKQRARKNLWRIPERTLLAVAILGGSFGGVLGMRLLRHKTRKPTFYIGFPCIFAAHALLFYFFIFPQINGAP